MFRSRLAGQKANKHSISPKVCSASRLRRKIFQDIPSTHWRNCPECAILFQKTLCSVAFLHEHPGKHTSVHESKFDKNLDSMIFTRIYTHIYLFTSLMIWFIYIYDFQSCWMYLIWKPKGSSLSSPNGPFRQPMGWSVCAGDPRRRAAGVTTGSRWASAGLLRRPEKVWDMFAAWDGIQMDSVQDILYRIVRII